MIYKQKSRKLEASDFLIETKPQEPLLAALPIVRLFRDRLVVLRNV
ncbi:hypothetical protein AQBE111736_13640 [Aquirufa beregesia]